MCMMQYYGLALTIQATNEEKLQIAQHYLLSSPPGQFNEVLADVRKIVSEDLLTDALVNGIARVSNLKNSKVVVTPSGKKTVVNQASEIDPTHYYDPIDNVTFTINHLTLATAEDPVPSNQDENHEDVRAAVQTAVSSYVSGAYQSEQAAGGVFAKDDKLYVVITGEKNNLKNFWSGKWNSIWTVNLSGQSATVTGEIKIHVHYFEDGNLQLQSNKSVPASTINFSSNSDLGSQLVRHIQNQESILQNGLEDMYSNMNNETFRSMRRIMPITRTKMDWNVNAVRMVRQVRKQTI